MLATIDHLVVTAPSLALGAKMLHEALGIWPQPGGEHARMGTHNLLLQIRKKTYLEGRQPTDNWEFFPGGF